MKPYYQDEFVTLYHGDCREVTVWTTADVLLTDPPYGIGYSRKSRNDPAYAGELKRNLVADREPSRDDVRVRDAALALWGYERPALIFGSWRSPKPFRTQNRLIWSKGAPSSGGAGPWRPSEEEIYLTGWRTKKWREKGDPWALNVIPFRNPHNGETDANGRLHPSIKPVGLLQQLLELCPPGIVADPFAGSGSTLIAARNLGRKVIGVELEEKYCEVIVKRLAQQAFVFDL